MKFLDQARVYIKSGGGGDGCLSFRRERFVAMGGPDGGDGGDGGNVWVECVDNLNTLIDFRYQQHYKAGRGIGGMGRDRSGKAGDDVVLQVPPGTQIFEEDNETLIGDLTEPGERLLLASGGNGGFGNARFKSATNQAPRRINPGELGEEKEVWLRLKLIADAGLVGLPNAGKSTFLAAVSAAKPKIANYPFTTLHPNLGVVKIGTVDFVLADIPGLIEGAHEGAGIGDRFLGHVERCRINLHLIDVTNEDVCEAYDIIRGELAAYGNGLDEKDELIALTKCDAVTEDVVTEAADRMEEKLGVRPMTISAVSGQGVEHALHQIGGVIRGAQDIDRLERNDDEPQDDGWRP